MRHGLSESENVLCRDRLSRGGRPPIDGVWRPHRALALLSYGARWAFNRLLGVKVRIRHT